MEIIVALSDNFAIGNENKLLWHIPEDLKHFKEITTGHTVIMGRNTWESLPPTFRPLPKRNNIVLSRNPDYVAQGATVMTSLTDAISSSEGKVFVIGGSQIYKEALPLADVMHITQVHQVIYGDAFFPKFDFSEWKLVQMQTIRNHTYDFSFLTFVRV